MNTACRWVAADLSLLPFAAFGERALSADVVVPPQGQFLMRQLDQMDVENKWIAGAHVNWETGAADDATETLPGRHTTAAPLSPPPRRDWASTFFGRRSMGKFFSPTPRTNGWQARAALKVGADWRTA